MAGEDIIRMSVKELKRLPIIQKVIGKELTQIEASDILSLCDRQIRRIVKRVKEEGDKGIIHKSRERLSNRIKPAKTKQKILGLCKTRYKGFNPTFASEKLFEID
ncbi:MAG: ISNCY family transposase, partial [Candidatus Omnitrophica bacterium]|nr:ISNCY family transposase [Candidatus Omnitrophota bacterium]